MAAGHVQEFQLTRNTTTACLPCSSALRLGLLVQLVGLAAKYSSEAHFLFFFFLLYIIGRYIGLLLLSVIIRGKRCHGQRHLACYLSRGDVELFFGGFPSGLDFDRILSNMPQYSTFGRRKKKAS